MASGYFRVCGFLTVLLKGTYLIIGMLFGLIIILVNQACRNTGIRFIMLYKSLYITNWILLIVN